MFDNFEAVQMVTHLEHEERVRTARRMALSRRLDRPRRSLIARQRRLFRVDESERTTGSSDRPRHARRHTARLSPRAQPERSDTARRLRRARGHEPQPHHRAIKRRTASR